MNQSDLVTIFGNISHSLYPLQRLISGGAYLLGILFFITAISKLHKIADNKANSPSHEKMFAPLMYLLFGAALLYLPSALDVMANTAFGPGNVLTYANYDSGNIRSVMTLMVRTAGILWFVRGCVLIVHASEPGTGEKDGLKGLTFLIAGVFAMNFESTTAMLNNMLNYFISWTMTVKTS